MHTSHLFGGAGGGVEREQCHFFFFFSVTLIPTHLYIWYTVNMFGKYWINLSFSLIKRDSLLPTLQVLLLILKY